MHVGFIDLDTDYPARMGARAGGKRSFRGMVACLQVYDVALTREQVADARRACKKYE